MSGELKILLVEDSPGDARLLEEEARDGGMAGIRITQASRIDEALRLHRDGAFDLIVLDLNLPDARGLGSVERMIAATGGATPVVVLTTLADDVLSSRAIAAGADDYLVKGECESWQLVRALRHAVARRRRQPPALSAGAAGEAGSDARLELPGEPAIRRTFPQVFDDLVGSLADILEIATGARREEASAQIAAFVERLVLLGASPADVAELHAAATTRCRTGLGWGRSAPGTEAARPVLLTLVAELCQRYRREVLHEPLSAGGAHA